MKGSMLCLIVVGLLMASCAVAQDMTGGKRLTESYIANLRDLVGSDVIIKGIAGSVKIDASNTVVYALTDKFGKTIRVRAAQGNPPLAQTYLVHGVVNERNGELELTELERRTPASALGVGPPETWEVVPGPGISTGGGAAGGASNNDGGAGDAESIGETKNNLPYLLLGGGAILVMAAVAVGLSMKSANDRRMREEQMRLEQQRMLEMQRQAEAQRPVVQPGSTVVESFSPAVFPPSPGTMVSWGSLTVVAGPLKDAVFPLPHGAISIGRNEGDIVLQTDQSVSSRHATISQAGDGTVYFEEHSTNGSFVNERRLNNEKVALHTGDRIVIGPHTLEIKFSQAAVAAAPSPTPGAATVVVPAQHAATVAFTGLELVVEEGVDRGNTFPVDASHTTVGRENCSVMLTDEHVSRKHATISNEEGKWVLQNESNQGTMVNDAKVETQELHDGDRIRMGRTVLRFTRLA